MQLQCDLSTIPKISVPAVHVDANPKSHSESRSIAYIPALDGLRGLAILTVVLHHSMVIRVIEKDHFGKAIHAIFTPGWIGVDLFFVLSGFLITSILLANRGEKGWLPTFYARRALRVLPLYYSVVFFCFWVAPYIPAFHAGWLRELSVDQLWYWLHGANFRRIESHMNPLIPTVGWFSTFWSLAIEEQFYLVWPLAVIASGRQLLRYSLLGVLIVTVMRFYSGICGSDLLTYFHTVTRLDGLLLGSALAAYLKNGLPLEQLAKPSKYILPAAALAFGLQVFTGMPQFGRSTYYGQLVLYSASSWGCVALLVLALRAPATGLYSRCMNSSFLRFSGKLSFGMYVLNKPVLAGWALLVGAVAGPVSGPFSLILVALGVALCMLAAWLSWICIEQPAMRLKRYFPTGSTVPQAGGVITN